MFSQPHQFSTNEQLFAPTAGALNWSLPPDISISFDSDPNQQAFDPSSVLLQQPLDIQLLLQTNADLLPDPSSIIDPTNYLYPAPLSNSSLAPPILSPTPSDFSWLNSFLPSPSPAPVDSAFATFYQPTPTMPASNIIVQDRWSMKYEPSSALPAHLSPSGEIVITSPSPSSPPNTLSSSSPTPSTPSSRSSTPESMAPSVTDILTSCETLGISPSNLLTDLGSIPAPTKSGRNIAPKIYSCPVPGCNHTFTRLFNLRAHAKTHDPSRNRPFQCTECDKSFCRQHDLDRHATVHSKVRAFNCGYCLRPFTRIDAKNRHERDKCHVVKAIRGEPKVAAAVLAAVVANHKTSESG